ncbi:hypothetical protein MTBLM5_10256 [Magnetospirillum sp. LM-5]|uniref:hypothetical protein n=1 Tax=Magnetospirillum sp. LM-5 TaxID=2681466 RepID=UPI0013804D97|nr:hypothetical protein [Magnetospirillum sp. LM-5]CAA7611973.1 hypothetical protein MTBLM5_10256 [Magnetospirillum sp. LM-5]
MPSAKIISHERFLMFRSAVELQRAADGLRAMTVAFDRFNQVVDSACEMARASLIEAEQTLSQRSGRAAEERNRTLDILEQGDIEAMIAERDRLLLAHDRDCRTCPDYAPAQPDGCRRSLIDCPSIQPG